VPGIAIHDYLATGRKGRRSPAAPCCSWRIRRSSCRKKL